MSKELKAFSRIMEIYGKTNSLEGTYNDFLTIKKALKQLEAIKNVNPSVALDCLERIGNIELSHTETCCNETKDDEYIETLVEFIDGILKDNYKEEFTTIEQSLLKAQKQEKENDILKEIIKSLFDRGCPLHQYVDKDCGLTIEVDDECSIMHLGKYKGVDLDEKLKEVLKNE